MQTNPNAEQPSRLRRTDASPNQGSQVTRLPEYAYQAAILIAVLLLLWTAV